MITTPVSQHIAEHLAANGFGVLGTTVFYGEWGDTDAQILCLDSPGTPSDIPELYEQPAFQVLVRGAKKGDENAPWGYASADVYAVAKGVSDFILSQLDTVVLGGVSYRGFEEASSLAPLGKDDNARFNYSANFYTWRNRT